MIEISSASFKRKKIRNSANYQICYLAYTIYFHFPQTFVQTNLRINKFVLKKCITYFLGLLKAKWWSNSFSRYIKMWYTGQGWGGGGEATGTLSGILWGQNYLQYNTKMLFVFFTMMTCHLYLKLQEKWWVRVLLHLSTNKHNEWHQLYQQSKKKSQFYLMSLMKH